MLRAVDCPFSSFADPSVEVLDEPSRRDFLRFMARLAGPGGHRRLRLSARRVDRALRAGSRGDRPGQAAVLRLGRPHGRLACGVLVKSQMGRPTKIEGNPDHPASLGATDVFGQAAILTLYDPDRSQMVTHNGRVDTWEHFQTLVLDGPRRSCSARRVPACAS